ncbi:MAG TPA: hypothetical protein VH020_09325 [Stellaceae bacterium]|jgi:hypothetical protein|nr:hypothetical protein [Stellaceae bacterium]
MTARLTESELAAIEARANAATEGPWFDLVPKNDCAGSNYMIRSVEHNEQEAVIMYSRYDGTPWCLPEDRTFIAASRTDIPSLLLNLRAARMALKIIAEFPVTNASGDQDAANMQAIARAAVPTEGTKP